MIKRPFALVLTACLMVAAAGCTSPETVEISAPPDFQFTAPGPNPLLKTPNAEGNVAGFWQGIWHGIISPATLIMALVNQDARVYEVHNSGGPYELGFLPGVALIFGLLGVFAGSRRRL